jgi:hypothetical protein
VGGPVETLGQFAADEIANAFEGGTQPWCSPVSSVRVAREDAHGCSTEQVRSGALCSRAVLPEERVGIDLNECSSRDRLEDAVRLLLDRCVSLDVSQDRAIAERADRAELLGEMGAQVEFGENFVEVRGTGELRGIDADMNAISDTAMTLAALAPFATGPVRIRNVAHLRIQESDRLHAIATELTRLGVKVDELEDGLGIYPSAIRPAVVETYGDHRIAMSLALIGLRVRGIGIRDPHCVRKTFPEFFTKLEALYG